MSIIDEEQKIKEGVTIKPEAENDSTAINSAAERETVAPSPENTAEETQNASADAVTSTTADTLTAGQDTNDGEEKISLDETENNSADSTSAEEKNGAEDEDEVEKAIFTQTQVNRLAGKAREEGRASALKELFARYGVADEDELNGIFGKGQTYDDLNDEFTAQGNSVREVKAENALLRTGIVPERWDDVKAILGTKGLEISQENITAELSTHPEWKGVGSVDASVNVATKTPLTPEIAETMKNTPAAQPAAESKISPIHRLGTESGETDDGAAALEKKLNELFGL